MLVYALTVLVSSFLLFLVQPIIAKQILPWFGGSAAVWTTCLTFFQLLLLAGYAYSDAVQRLLPRTQSMLHIALLIASLVAMPIVAGEQWKPVGSEDPFWRILGLLIATIGLPYFMLSTTGPLIQSWFARQQSNPAVAQRAYRLFALSNFGSLMGLLAYPFAIEAWVTTRAQALGWSIAYGVFVALAMAVAIKAMRHKARAMDLSTQDLAAVHQDSQAHADSRHAAVPTAPTAQSYVLWFSLAAIATAMLLAVSSHITQNIASIPFLWVLPLSLYLLTFVIAFEGRHGHGWYLRNSMMLPAMVVVAFMAWGLTADDGVLDIDYAIPLYLGGLFLSCLFCHGELAHAKPAARFLTRFYFMIALGGAAGGLFVSMVAPKVLPFYWELPLTLVLVGAAGIWIGVRAGHGPLKTVFIGGSFLSLAVSVFYAHEQYTFLASDSVYASRNFYGTLRIKERHPFDSQEPVRRLVHGVILHGLQDMRPEMRQKPTSYYGAGSGVGLAIRELQRASPQGIRVGVVGLGVGTLASYGRKGDQFRMYDINPQVIELAKTGFTYLQDSPAAISYALGDARLVLEREPSHQFDVLVIDAFSSDSIPIHLMTRQAMQAYIKHIKPSGVIAFHVTNRYLNLAPVVAKLAKDAGLDAALVSDEPGDDARGVMALSDWVLVTKQRAWLAAKPIAQKTYPIDEIPGLGVWTDDFNNLFQVLK